MDEKILHSKLGKMGDILWAFANGYDDSPVKYEDAHAPIKSIGNSTTTPRDLVNDQDVKIVLTVLAESVAARLRENGFKCRVVEISVRDNGLFSFTRQKKIDHATNVTREIAEEAYRLFKENYDWKKPIRSVGVRGADLVNDNYWEQIDLFSSVEFREKQMKMDEAVDTIRKRFGFYSVQRGLMYFDRALSAVDATFTKDGRLLPRSFIWTDGHRYEIQCIKQVCRAASLKAGGVGMRYTCVIDGRESHLYYEDNNMWFVEGR